MSLRNKIFKILDVLLPKRKAALIMGSAAPFLEPNTLELANYIAKHKSYPVFLVIHPQLQPWVVKMIDERVELIAYKSRSHLALLLTAKYIYTCYNTILHQFSRRQVFVNIWHGSSYKTIWRLTNPTAPALKADVTVTTSPLFRTQFAKAFGVPEAKVLIAGYPRNDLMMKACEEKADFLNRLPEIQGYQKRMIWLPTFRTDHVGAASTKDGQEENNPFLIKNFDPAAFNSFLKQNNTLCIIKPHPRAAKNFDYRAYDHILVMDDVWLLQRGMTLYHLLGLTDLLVSDFSSVMIDYLLLDKPVICFSTDYEAYLHSRGFYFDPIEDYLPGKLFTEGEAFFTYLEQVLSTGKDAYSLKREKIKKLFFTYPDGQNSKRLLEEVEGRR